MLKTALKIERFMSAVGRQLPVAALNIGDN
jgi:hypothetical protein